MEDEKSLNMELENEDEIDNEEVDNPDETKNEKFIRIAEGRVTKLLSWVRKLDNLSNRGNYDYTDEQIEQMFGVIEKNLAEVKSHFLRTEKEEKRFKFK